MSTPDIARENRSRLRAILPEVGESLMPQAHAEREARTRAKWEGLPVETKTASGPSPHACCWQLAFGWAGVIAGTVEFAAAAAGCVGATLWAVAGVMLALVGWAAEERSLDGSNP
ncbi:MAG: hypothetical protein GX591_14130 [Planctomycetes bacterium]|nr:hypothetical protein [Planctomycetota bacterium]